MQLETAQIDINYPPEFQCRYGYGSPVAQHINSLFESKQDVQIEFVEAMAKLKPMLSQIPFDAPAEAPQARWNQPWFPPLDGMSMYAMIAHSKPQRYIEIGSGHSTKFAAAAVNDHNLDTQIISVDPQPRAEVDEICDLVIRQRLENADQLQELIAELQPNDVVFFDGSHRCFQNSDVTVFFIDYLPSIPDGVKIGIHDIFWPNDYPPSWIERYYNEQYVLGAYMLGMGSQFPLIFSCAFMGVNQGKMVTSCLSEELINQLHDNKKGIGGGAIWFEKKGI